MFANRLGLALMVGAVGLSAPYLAYADDAAQSKAVTITLPAASLDDAIRDFLKRNPEAVGEALADLQAKQAAKKQEDAKAAITNKSSDIYGSDSPVAGNPNGSETLVEFFDYSCHYCKQIHPDLQTLIKDDPNLKVIYKDFPILGPGSMLAAKAALAAKNQGKYMEMHNAMLDFKGPFDDASIKQIAEDKGLDYTKLKADMDKPEVAQAIQANMSLASTLDIHGTPSMIINHDMVDGALPLDQLKAKVKDNKG